MSKSAVSRRFVAATAKAMAELMARSSPSLDVAVLMIDEASTSPASSDVVVCLVITTDGTRLPVGLWLGDTENKTVVTALLTDLVSRGLDTESGMLCVIDGAKALAAGTSRRCSAMPPSRTEMCPAQAQDVEGHLPKGVGRSQRR